MNDTVNASQNATTKNTGLMDTSDVFRSTQRILADRMDEYDRIENLAQQRLREKLEKIKADAEELESKRKSYDLLLQEKREKEQQNEENLKKLGEEISNLESATAETDFDDEAELENEQADPLAHLSQDDINEAFKNLLKTQKLQDTLTARQIEKEEEKKEQLKKDKKKKLEEERERRMAFYNALTPDDKETNETIINISHALPFLADTSYSINENTGAPVITHVFKSKAFRENGEETEEDKKNAVRIVNNGHQIFIKNQEPGQPVTVEQAIVMVMDAQAMGKTKMRTTGSFDDRRIIQEVAEMMGLEIQNKLYMPTDEDVEEYNKKSDKSKYSTRSKKLFQMKKSITNEMQKHLAQSNIYLKGDAPELRVLEREINTSLKNTGEKLNRTVLSKEQTELIQQEDIDAGRTEPRNLSMEELIAKLPFEKQEQTQAVFREFHALATIKQEIKEITTQNGSTDTQKEFLKQKEEMGITADAIREAREEGRLILQREAEPAM